MITIQRITISRTILNKCETPKTKAELEAEQQVATLLEAELAERMVNSIAAELATDIKQILSVKERREMLRGIAREHMDAVMKAGA